MNKTQVNVRGIECGADQLFLISGPCVIEDEYLMLKTAEKIRSVSHKLSIPLIFKSSFQKDNRTSVDYYSGPGIEQGLKILQKIKSEFDIPILTDIHYPHQVTPAAEVVDVIQIPAYLCMQTELILEAAKSGQVINIKKGQFVAPEGIIKPIQKVESTGNKKIIVTERGFTFGYNDLVVDPRSFYHLQETGYPVVFDVTHAIRKYGIPSSDPSGGARQYLPVLARSGVAAGVDGLFIEAHPNPPEALCDAASQLNMNLLEEFLKPLIELHNIEVTYR